MNKNILGDGAFEANAIVTSEALATLRRLADQVIILEDLPKCPAVDPDLRASLHPYSPMRSEMPLPSLDVVLGHIRSAYGQPGDPNPA